MDRPWRLHMVWTSATRSCQTTSWKAWERIQFFRFLFAWEESRNNRMLSQAIPVRQVKNNSKETAHWRNIAMEFMQHFHGEVNQNTTPLVHLPCMCLNTCFSWSRYACTQVLSSLCFMDNRYCLSASKRIKYSKKPDISTTYIGITET